MLLMKNCEMFCTGSLEVTDEDCLVDQILIDKDSKEYLLQKNEDERITDGHLANGYEINSVCVSRFIFDIIVDGVRCAGFKEAIYV